MKYEQFVSDVALDPERLFFVKDFGPALLDHDVLLDGQAPYLFTHFYDQSKKVVITEATFAKVLMDITKLSPEVQYVIALMDMAYPPEQEGDYPPDEELN